METFFYHRAYEILQPLGFLGRWELSGQKHINAISEHFIQGEELSVLYLGTATARNPIDAKNSLERAGYKPDMTVVDIAGRPLEKISSKKLQGIKTVKADACALSVCDLGRESFDIITSDFLLNMCPISKGAQIVSEMEKSLSANGIITMTVFTEEQMSKRAVQFLYTHYASKHFTGNEEWEQIFANFGLSLNIEVFNPSKKPFLYHANNFSHFIAKRPLSTC